MADETFDDGLLDQDDINAALEAAGLGEHGVKNDSPEKPSPKASGGGSAAAENPARRPADTRTGDQRVDSAGRPFDEVAAAMAEAIAAESATGADSQPKSSPRPNSSSTAAPLDIPQLDDEDDGTGESQSIDLLRDVNLDVKIELGRSRMYVEDVLRLNEGSIVELDKLAGDPVDVLVNGRLVARGEVLVLNDTFCVRINDIVSKLPSEELPV